MTSFLASLVAPAHALDLPDYPCRPPDGWRDLLYILACQGQISAPDTSSDAVPRVCSARADQINFTLNFSKGASQIVAQYYQVCGARPPVHLIRHLMCCPTTYNCTVSALLL
jgi:hypothetical protein